MSTSGSLRPAGSAPRPLSQVKYLGSSASIHSGVWLRLVPAIHDRLEIPSFKPFAETSAFAPLLSPALPLIIIALVVAIAPAFTIGFVRPSDVRSTACAELNGSPASAGLMARWSASTRTA